jgi:hypothetical protein
MKLKLQTCRNILLLAMIFVMPATVNADVVTDWNAIAVQAMVNANRPGPSGVVDIAIVHVAIYDAVQAIEKRYAPYYVEVPGASGSPVAAAAKAAHDVLVNRFSSQAASITSTYQQYLLMNGLSENDPGVEVGAKAAAGIIALRACDGSFPVIPPPPFIGGTAPGVWRPTPPANLAMAAPWLGNVTPFAMTRPSQFRSAPPPALTSREYTRDYNEVKTIGALNSTTRNADQTDVAHFYAGNTPVFWNRALRDIAMAHVDNIADSSRLFALVDMAVADALIACWNDKTHYVFWRPITAIREGHTDGNPDTDADAGWQSLITTPNYPDYTSGAVNFATAVTTVLEHLFRTDHVSFSITTTNVGPTVQDTRTYHRFSAAVEDVVDARVYAGIHFRFADEAARKQGREIAQWTFKNYLRPLSLK